MLKITATVGKPFKIQERPGSPGRMAVVRRVGANRVELVLLDDEPTATLPAQPAVTAAAAGGDR